MLKSTIRYFTLIIVSFLATATMKASPIKFGLSMTPMAATYLYTCHKIPLDQLKDNEKTRTRGWLHGTGLGIFPGPIAVFAAGATIFYAIPYVLAGSVFWIPYMLTHNETPSITKDQPKPLRPYNKGALQGFISILPASCYAAVKILRKI